MMARLEHSELLRCSHIPEKIRLEQSKQSKQSEYTSAGHVHEGISAGRSVMRYRGIRGNAQKRMRVA
jgi:hypothetical protein